MIITTNTGYRITYLNAQEPRESAEPRYHGILFSDNLEKIAQKIAQEWVQGSCFTLGNYCTDSYFSRKGDLLEANRINSPGEIDRAILNMTFVNHTLRSLERTVKGFGLPFDRKKVRKETSTIHF